MEDEEEDLEIARMRDMLLSTQSEIDKIIEGTSKVQSIYEESKRAVM